MNKSMMEALKRKMIEVKGHPKPDQEFADGQIEGDAMLDEEKKQRGETDLAPELHKEEKEYIDEAEAEREMMGKGPEEAGEAPDVHEAIKSKIMSALGDKSSHGRHASSLGERAAFAAKHKMHSLKKA